MLKCNIFCVTQIFVQSPKHGKLDRSFCLFGYVWIHLAGLFFFWGGVNHEATGVRRQQALSNWLKAKITSVWSMFGQGVLRFRKVERLESMGIFVVPKNQCIWIVVGPMGVVPTFPTLDPT